MPKPAPKPSKFMGVPAPVDAAGREVNLDEKKRVGVAEDACAKTARGAEAEARQKSEDMLRLLAAVHAQPSVVRGAGPIKP